MQTLGTYQVYAATANLADRERVTHLAERFAEIAADRDKVAALRTLAQQEGMSFGTVRRQYYKWAKNGAAAIADRRKQRTGDGESVFYPTFKRYAERDMNTSRGGYEAMMRDFRSGATFPFGTWRDVWAREFPFERVPALCPANWTPNGMGYANLMKIQERDASRALALSWSRRGEFAALGNVLPVIRSREGLLPGQVVQADDVWHNFDVFKPGVKGVFNPLEFAFYDVASAFKVVSMMKPRTLTVDSATGKEKRDNLNEFQFRIAVADLMCVVGFHKGGIRLVGERGTTALRDAVLRRIAAVPGYGRLFRFETSGVKNAPAHRGLFMGNAGGNPRMKSLCECSHNIMHNATASLLGNHGRDNQHKVEGAARAAKYALDVIEEARAIDPAIIPLLRLPILEYSVYQSYFYAIQNVVMDRTNHHLEGWGRKWVTEYRLSETSDEWRRTDELKDMPSARAEAVAAVLATNPSALMRQRQMSRREAWAAGAKDLIRWPLLDAPAFLDPRDAREATVRPDGTIAFTDATYYPGETKRYVAQYADRRTGVQTRLAPGSKVRFYFIPVPPLDRQIWITDDTGDLTLGMAPLLKTAAWADEGSIKEAMGQQRHFIAEQMADTRAGNAAVAAAKGGAIEYNRALISGGPRSVAAAPAAAPSRPSFAAKAEPEADPARADELARLESLYANFAQQ